MYFVAIKFNVIVDCMLDLLVQEQRYLSSSPTFLKYQIDIYWPIMKTKVTNNEYSLHSM